ncbi:MAG: S8 family serine peptidase [Ignavibacteria bacterium]|nr:S8 family serine peptidase [Ignavibacteria bacterium]
MKRIFVIVFLFLICTTQRNLATETLIVTLKSSNSVAAFVKNGAQAVIAPEAISNSKLPTVQTVQLTAALSKLKRHVVIDCSNNVNQQIVDLLTDSRVESVKRNHKFKIDADEITNDSLSVKQYGLRIVNAAKAWKIATGVGSVVGVLDTGFDWDHPDLVSQVRVGMAEDVNKNGTFEAWPSTVQIGGKDGDLDGIDNDGNGFVDDVIGYDFVDQSVRNLGDDRDRDPIPFDEQGHGTSVAGVIAATANNTIGMAGLAYNARLVALRAFDATGNGEEDDIATALVYAAMNGVQIINMSFGDGVDSPVLRDAVEFARQMGCVLIASAGNTGVVSRQFPAGYDGVLVVASTNEDDVRSPFSSTGSIVNMCAPGERIVTTAINSRYRTVSGTSFSAPLTAAVAALLLEKFPAATASEITSTILENTVDLGVVGWDSDYGVGRLDAFNLVSAIGLSDVFLSRPINEEQVNVKKNSILQVEGSTLSTMSVGYELFWGRGLEPVQWNKFGEGGTKYKSTLGSVDLSAFNSGVYVIRLVVRRLDSRTIEIRKRINVSNDDTLRILESKIETAWIDDLKTGVLTIETNQNTYCSVEMRSKGDSTQLHVTDIKRFTRLHSLPLDGVTAGDSVFATVTCVSGSADTVRTTISFYLQAIASPLTTFNVTQTVPLAGYVLNDVRDFYSDGKSTFVMNDVSSGSFGSIVTKQRDVLGFKSKDSLSKVWIPRGVGDTDGNGRLEVFAHVVGSAILFESSTVNGNPFEVIRFADSTGKLNATAMADVDGDGREDLIMLSDSGCVVYSWKDGKYALLATALNVSTPPIGNFANRIDEVSVGVGDFNGNGQTEIAFSDTDGDLLIYEFDGSKFVMMFMQENSGAGGSGYVASGDIDGDGKPDIVLGIPDSVQARPDGEYGRQMWTYRFFRSTNLNAYEEFWTERIYGVRYGIGFRNGVEIGQLDMRNGSEVVICAFPRLYIFTWDKISSTMLPFWYKPDVVSPRFLVHDFNSNGVNEIGYGTTSAELGYMTQFAFAEADTTTSGLNSPAGLRATLQSDTTAVISWMPVTGAQEYEVQRATSNNPIFKTFITVSSVTIRTDSLEKNKLYKFRVVAIASNAAQNSRPSAAVEVFTGQQIIAQAAVPDTNVATNNSNSVQIRVRYSGAINQHITQPSAFVLMTSADSILAVGSSAVAATDNEIIVGFRLASLFQGKADLFCGAILDANEVPTLTSRLPLTIKTERAEKPLIINNFTLNGSNAATLSFSEPMDVNGLTDAANYLLAPTGKISSVSILDDSTVQATFGTDPPLAALGLTYSLTVSSVRSSGGVPITTGAGNTVQFVLASTSANDVFVYPHPITLSTDNSVTFANLPPKAVVEIIDQRFSPLQSLHETDGNGGVEWNLRTSKGEALVPGVYFYRVTGTTSSGAAVDSGLQKFWVKR